tara:strand:+ start:3509 stop:6355 length:2847 start_codon:yes stop_codon:yes gene_type:complete
MSDKIDLLSTVQPSSGWFCILGIKDNKVKQSLVKTREEADKLIATFVTEKNDVYFGVAKFKSDVSRVKTNVEFLKALWVDIDCGESKAKVDERTGRPDGYIDQATAIVALKTFCQTIGLPKPILVNSGRGIHAYWSFVSDVTREQWEPVAARLRDLCITHNFYVDTKVFEAARVLRVPETFNFKDNPPKPVQVILSAEAVEFQEIKNILGVKETITAPPKTEMSAMGKAMMANLTSNFSKIMMRSARGNGCTQLLHSYKQRADLSEPRWFSALSIAKFCKDKDDAIHKISSGHPEYDPANTEKKIAHILGPHSCVEFERGNPGGCEGCTHKGKITSPISLGKEVLEADVADNNVLVSSPDEGVADKVHVVPEFPNPYIRGKHGGIYVSLGEDEEPICIYQNDLYVVKRMRDPLWGEVTLVKLHLPRDGVKEFVIPNSQITDPKELRRILSSQGVACNGKKFKLLTDFILVCINDLQLQKRAEQMRQQFGWADKDTKFILGDREISVEGVYHSPPSSATKDLAPHLQPKGTLEAWKEVFKLYGKPGLEPHAFGTLSSFGAPLLKFLGQTGAIINLIHSDSGTGKSTVLRMCNSVWGHPTKIGLMWDDTFVSKMLTLGMLNNLPFTVDEVTNMHPKEFSTLVYSMSQGRGRHRAKANANELRINNTTWSTISLCTSNSPFYQKLGSIKNSPDGEMMRLLEYRIEPSTIIPAAEAKEMFDHELSNNYGHAGEIYIKYLLANFEEVTEAVKSIQGKLDKELQLEAKERFWSAVVAANITGGLIAKRLELIDWDMKRIYAWATGMLQDLRQDTSPPATNLVSVVGDYINRHMQNILVVNDEADLRTNMQTLPVEVPRGELLIRYEPDTKKMFLATKPFKNDCVEYQIDYKDLLSQLKAKGIFIGSMVKRLGKGMKVATPGVHTLVFDCSNSDFLDLEEFIKPEHDSREGQLPN